MHSISSAYCLCGAWLFHNTHGRLLNLLCLTCSLRLQADNAIINLHARRRQPGLAFEFASSMATRDAQTYSALLNACAKVRLSSWLIVWSTQNRRSRIMVDRQHTSCACLSFPCMTCREMTYTSILKGVTFIPSV